MKWKSFIIIILILLVVAIPYLAFTSKQDIASAEFNKGQFVFCGKLIVYAPSWSPNGSIWLFLLSQAGHPTATK